MARRALVNIPEWASSLVKRIASDHSLGDITLKWSQKQYETSTEAVCTPSDKEVHIIAGTDETDAKVAICHEMAHLVLGEDDNHPPKFWSTYIGLIRRYRIPIRAWLQAEGDRLHAAKVYKEMGGTIKTLLGGTSSEESTTTAEGTP